MEIRRFGPGHRRSQGPPGTQGVAGVVIYSDERAVVSELAFGRYAMVTPHTNPANTAIFIVLSGAGYVQVGDERERINHGESVVWPAGIPHGAYTDGSEMRALIVELTGDGKTLIEATPADELQATPADRAEGALADRTPGRADYDSSEGEPW